MRCTNCQYENRPGALYCEHCGALLPKEPPDANLCPKCSFANRPDAQYCERCGAPLAGINDITETEEEKPEQEKHKGKKKRKSRVGKFFLRIGFVLLLIILILMLIGAIPSDTELSPQISSDPHPLVILSGVSSSEGYIAVEAEDFSASGMDSEGIQRMELYVDGELTAAENFDGSATSVVFDPPLETLPEGEYEVFVRTTNTRGQANQSQVVLVENSNHLSPDVSGSLVVETDPNQFPAPKVVVAKLNDSGNRILVSWELPLSPIKSVRVYVRIPGSSGLVLVGEINANQTQFTLPASTIGTWDVYVSFVNNMNEEGALGHTSVFIPDPESNVITIDEITGATITLFPTSDDITRMWIYYRVGGPNNRYQRFPAGQMVFIVPNVNSKYIIQLSELNWSASQPLQVDAEVWGGIGDYSYRFLGQISTTIQAEDITSGKITYSGSGINIEADLAYTQKYGVLATVSVGGPRLEILPPPFDIHMAVSTADCQLAASALGNVRDALYSACKALVLAGNQSFLLWDWTGETDNFRYSEEDITGFELKLVLSNQNDEILGESVTAIPFVQARGIFRPSQEVDCGINQTWYLRTVGINTISEWAYAGSIPASTCEEPYPPYNGCGGQMDFLPDWNPFGDFVPDLMFGPACNAHDQCYVQAWSGKSKVTCDNEFLWDMLEICEDYILMIDPATCGSLASQYYEAVNMFGRFFYEGDIDVMDCTYAVEPVMCFTAATPEFIGNVWNGTKGAAIWTKESLQTGAEKAVDGGEWLVENIKDAWPF
jgi:hypothetical protein